ncbi:MAG: glucose-6-phosphate isomerase family protein [Candidatus Helarchaeota archaeon]
MLGELFHTKGNCHMHGEFEVYRVVMGEIAFVQTSRQLKDSSVILAREGDLFNVIPYYFHRAVNVSRATPLVTSDIRPLNTETSYSPIEEKGFPFNIVSDEDGALFLRKKNTKLIPLKETLPEVTIPDKHSEIRIDKALIYDIIDAAKRNQIIIGTAYKDTGYIVTNVRKVSEMAQFFINPEEAAKIDEIVYITLDGRFDEVNIVNGLTIVLPGIVPI